MLSIPSTPLIAKIVLLAGVLLAIFALLSPSHHPAYAQEMIEYAENGTDTVAAFTAMDPEEEDIVWSLTGVDMDDFSIDGGVLTFKDGPPDFEDPKGGAGDDSNTYTVTVNAGDGGVDTTATRIVTVKVTNVEEPGTVELSTLQPKQAVTITATLTDDDGSIDVDLSPNPSDKDFDESGIILPTWQWATSESPSGPWDDVKVIEDDPATPVVKEDQTATPQANGTSATYEPRASDVGSYLRATATYNDGHGEDDPYTEDLDESEDTARMTSDNSVLMADYENTAPTFPDQDPDMDGIQDTEADRSIAEDAETGDPVGDPVVASDIGADGSQETLFYTLTGTDASSFTINERTGQISVGTTLDYETESSYTVTVWAADPSDTVSDQSREEIEVTITVTDINEAPKITRSQADETEIDFRENASIANPLRTFAATDEDSEDSFADDTLTWTVVRGASTRQDDSRRFKISVDGALTFEAQPDYDSPWNSNNTYKVKVVVTDSANNADSEEMTIAVRNENEEGTVTLSNRQAEVGTAITATLTDEDKISGVVTWEWTFGSETITLTGGLTSTYTPMDTHARTTLNVIANYDDTEGTGKTASVPGAPDHINSVQPEPDANDPNTAPKFIDSQTCDPGTTAVRTVTRQVDENTEANEDIGLPVEFCDAEDSDLTYSLSGSNVSSFDIDRSTGQLKTKAKLDIEKKSSYSVTVKATDPSAKSSTVSVKIEVRPINEPPEFTEGATATKYAEGDRGTHLVDTYKASDPEKGTITWTLLGTDAEDFTFERSELRFNQAPNYEDPQDSGRDNVYEVTLQASDGTTANDQDLEITVTVTNVDEDGEVTLTTLQPKEGFTITATLTDPDGGDGDPLPIASTETNLTEDAMWQWARSTNRTSWTDIEASETPLVTSKTKAYTPGKDDVGSYLRATATYTDGQGEDKTAQMVSDNAVAMKDYVNTAPLFPDQDPDEIGEQTAQTRELYENMAPGTDVGDPVTATDIGSDGSQEVLVYTLPDNYAGPFAIDRATGQISVGARAMLDYETTNAYSVEVTAEDPSGEESAPITVTITVKDVQEAPKLAGVTADVDPVTEEDHPENTDITTIVATYTATDDEDDNGVLEWSLSGADSDKFEIDTDTGATVALSFEASPDFENPADSGGNNVYNVTVKVTDSRGRTDSVDVAVMVTNVEEDGVVTLSNRQPEVGVPIRAMLTDPDDGVRDVTWQWSAASADIVGAKSASYTPVSGDMGKELTATATYRDSATEDNQFTPDDESEDTVAGASEFTVKDTDSNNQAPVFPDQDDGTPGNQSDRATRYVREDAAPNNPVVINKDGMNASISDDPVAATDEVDNDGNNGDVLTYTLTGPDAGSFTIDTINDGSDSVVGQIRVKTGTELDYETKNTYTVTVVATDPSDASDTIIVTIMLRDVDEAPEIMKRGLAVSGDRSIRYAENDTADVATYMADGADSAGAAWSLSGDDAGDFSISSGGVLTFRSSPNFESPSDQGGNNVYNVMVRATSTSGTITATRNVTVTVTNEDEGGTVTLSSNQATVGDELTAVVTDIDGGVISVTWQWARSSDDSTGWTNIAGATAAAYITVDDDANNYLRATASYTDAEGSGKSEEAVTTDEVEAATTIGDNGVVTLSETQPTMGVELTASLTDSDGGVTDVIWQWARSSNRSTGWADISGATSEAYTPVNADVGNYLQATASYTDAQGPDQSASAATTAAVQASTTIGTTGIVTLPQTQPIMGDVLTASLTDSDGGVTGVRWQWARSESASGSWTNISGATAATYTPVGDDVRNYLQATASYADAQGPGQSASAATADAVLHRYDGNKNGQIERSEVIDAIKDFLFGSGTTRDEVLDLIGLYLLQ